MGSRLTIELPDRVLDRIQREAERSRRPFDSVLSEWIENINRDAILEAMDDDELLEACEQSLSLEIEARLEELLDLQQNATPSESQQTELRELMTLYRQTLLSRSKAFSLAVRRGLRPR